MSWRQFWSVSCQSGGRQAERVSSLLVSVGSIFAKVDRVSSGYSQGRLASLRQRPGSLSRFPASTAQAAPHPLPAALHVFAPSFHLISLQEAP